MTDKLVNLLKQHAEQIINTRIFVKRGIINNYDPNLYLARVSIQPDEVTTGWLQIASFPIGVFVAPHIGDICQVLYAEGDINGGLVALFINNVKPSIPVQSGEILIENVGKFNLKVAHFSLNSANDINMDASNINIHSSNVTVGNGNSSFHKVVTDVFKNLFNEHTHPSSGSPPSQQMDNSHLTTNTEVN